MNSISLINLGYKRVLKEARAMLPGYNEQTALEEYLKIKSEVASAALFSLDNDRAVNALRDKGWAIELFQIFAERKN